MPDATVHVACLCAAWCRTCDDYAPIFERVAREAHAATAGAGTLLRLHWIDIEDEADLVGDYDVETFPTIVVAADDETASVRFAGPITPEPETLARLLRSRIADAAPGGGAWPAVPPPVQAMVERLRRRAGTEPA